MAGGTFDRRVAKVRPGTYVNFVGKPEEVLSEGFFGHVAIPMIKSAYGPAGQWITISDQNPNEQFAKLGFKLTDNDENRQMLLIREAMKNATTVQLYICTEGNKAKATVGNLTVTAMYGGTRGNVFRVVVAENIVDGFDVAIYLDTEKVENYEGVKTVEDLIKAGSEYVTFTGTGELTVTAGTTFAGGTNVTAENADITAYLDALENVMFNCAALPVTDAALQTAALEKVKYIRNEIGKGVQIVMPNAHSDFEGVIGLSNGYAMGDVELSVAEACAWVAGATAGASEIESNTYKVVQEATRVVGTKTHAEAIEAIKAGEMFFVLDDAGNVVIEYDINTLVTYGEGRNKSYSKNRVIRVLDSFQASLRDEFAPNKYDNDERGWMTMESMGKALLKLYNDLGAITNVDYENDFVVDRESSIGDSTYIDVRIQPVDSAEKLYITVSTE